MVDVVLVRSNPIIYDSRVGKIISSLNTRYSTVILGWNREGVIVSKTRHERYIFHMFNMKAPYGKISLLMCMPFFWLWVFSKLVILRPKVVHACDLDTVLPSYVYKILFKKKMIFDVFDRYAMVYVPQKFTALCTVVNLIEENFAKKADVLITVSKKLLSTFTKKPKHYAIIMNCAKDYVVKKGKLKDGVMTLVYTGPIMIGRGLECITQTIRNIDRVECIVAGKIIDKEFQKQIMKSNNVEYAGLLMTEDALNLEGNSDVMIALYDLKIPNYKNALPNKTFEAMMLGLPLITNVADELIDEIDCGIKVEYDNLNQIKSAIISLRDDLQLRRRLGINGRKAFEQKYNWKYMEDELYKIYDDLLMR